MQLGFQSCVWIHLRVKLKVSILKHLKGQEMETGISEIVTYNHQRNIKMWCFALISYSCVCDEQVIS